MHYTNKYGIPQEVVSAIVRDPYYHDGRISVTALIGPPRIHQLRKRYVDEIVEDVSERLFALYGQIAHGILERADDFDAIHEERLSMQVDGWKVTGATDLYKHHGNGEYLLRDYKFTSVYVSNFALKPEWIAQVNFYALLWRQHGFSVHRAQIVAVYRDWRRMEAERKAGYPPPVQLFNVPLWSREKALQQIEERVSLHRMAEGLPDEQLPLCTQEEQWRRGEKWACMKKGRKTAVRLYHTLDEAEEAAAGVKGGYVQHRPAEAVRCKYFCSVSPFCSQFQLESA
ncbi:hypothetical protein [Desulfoferrobacter suflitae]|uniref:hypothetical protein n=1 Tax=Desulfoferrobacter suflitae TaxID=2865782 RepID=UPI0021640A61|nr:hypothetical protein [Desulfoferrobacter suflitae]MCK8600097.1 hypothetical protein [Desulfoferrobacter suflitae]